MKPIVLLLSIVVLASCKVQHKVVDRPIVFDQQRIELTKAYLSNRYHLEQETAEIVPKMVVLHWTAINTFEKSFEAFKNSTLPSWRPEIAGRSGLNVSSHFLVDRDGTVFRLMPETTMARHVIGLNHCAIGIENVGGEAQPLTRKQLKANIWLVNYLSEKYPIEFVIGHHEYTLFEEHPLWLEVDDGYRTEKTDPGASFMKKVRRATKKLNFNSLPKEL